MLFTRAWPFFRAILFVLTVLAALGWILKAPDLLARFERPPDKAASEVEAIMRKLEAEDPKAANAFAQLRQQHGVLALAAALRDDRLKSGIIEAVKSSGKISPPDHLRLGDLASRGKLFDDSDDRREFLTAYGTALQLIDNSTAANAFLMTLQKSTDVDADWRAVKHDPVALLVWQQIEDARLSKAQGAALRAYFSKERVWLTEFLATAADWSVASAAEDGAGTEQAGASEAEDSSIIVDCLRIANERSPYFKEAVTVYKYGPEIIPMFDAFGSAITIAADRGLPLDEMLEVLFANQDFFDPGDQEKVAATLEGTRHKTPDIWNAARTSPLALRLNRDAPAVANRLLRNYAADDVPAMLYAAYEDEIADAAACVDKFGDLALFVLNEYAETPEFHEALTRPGVGPRLVPYVVMFRDKGLERIEDNQAWLDKYFARDGTPREEEWWTALPGGAAANVARNWCQGYPNEWSELGWAGLDAAEAVLFVASLGGSSAATSSAKTGAKTALKRQVLKTGSSRARSATRGMRDASRARKSLLKRVSGATFRLSKAGRAARRVWELGRAATNVAALPIRKLVAAARKLETTWQGVNPRIRRAVYRGLIGAGLYVTITQRTIPALDKIADAAGRFVAEVIKDAAKIPSQAMAGFFDELGKSVGAHGAWWKPWAAWIAGLAVLLIPAWFFRPFWRRRLRYAG